MIGMIRGELLKMRHSTMGRSMWVMPVITILLGYLIRWNSFHFFVAGDSGR